MTPWKLKRTRQCEHCPWRKATNPYDIPNGYTVERHRALKKTIADVDNAAAEFTALVASGASVQAMACHEMDEAHCIGWLNNQLGPGNNIMLRIQMASCTNARSIRLRGEQHATFEDTLPP